MVTQKNFFLAMCLIVVKINSLTYLENWVGWERQDLWDRQELERTREAQWQYTYTKLGGNFRVTRAIPSQWWIKITCTHSKYNAWGYYLASLTKIPFVMNFMPGQ